MAKRVNKKKIALKIKNEFIGLSFVGFGLFGLILISLYITNPTSLLSKASSDKSGNQTITQTFDLTTGWNLISLPIKSNLTAKHLCNQYEAVKKVAEWKDQSWNELECQDAKAKNNFSLFPNQGYALVTNKPVNLKVTGQYTPMDTPLVEGWNFIGIHQNMLPSISFDLVCNNTLFADSALKVTEVNRWLHGGWDSRMCELPFNTAFDTLNRGEGYFIQVMNSLNPESSTPPSPIQSLPSAN